MSDFQQRMHQASEDIYTRIVDPDHPPFDVEAALMQAHLNASTERSDD
jgi:hypothetical protein